MPQRHGVRRRAKLAEDYPECPEDDPVAVLLAPKARPRPDATQGDRRIDPIGDIGGALAPAPPAPSVCRK